MNCRCRLARKLRWAPRRRLNRFLVAFVLVALLPLLACVGGGCPFTHASAVTFSPATSCLSAIVKSSDQNCVTPSLSVTNACTEPLVIEGTIQSLGYPADASEEGDVDLSAPSDIVVDAGKTQSFAYAGGPVPGTISISAKLGSEALTISFTTSR
jgi:hypothetical protein